MRAITSLHPRLQNKIEELKKLCLANGLNIGISECLRTIEEQNALYAQGRTSPGNIVTNVSGNSYGSQHQWGIAVDFYRNDGTGAYNENGNFFGQVGNVAKSIGLGWGGDWKSFKDKPHLYLPDWGSTTKKLKNLYGTPDRFRETWAGTQPVAPVHPTQPTEPPKSSGNVVIQSVQSWCNSYVGAGLAIDGVYGKNTRKGLCKSLQRYHNINYGAGLAEDGAWGAKTKAACRVATGHSNLVYILQALLYSNGYDMSHSIYNNQIDGKMGMGTVRAIEQFQGKSGLVADGKAGKDTFGKLLS